MKLINIFLLDLIAIIVVISIFVLFLIMFCFEGELHFNGLKKEDDATLVDKIFNRFYFSTFIISTNGYGDHSPKSRTCKLVTMCFILTIIGGTISIVSKISQLSSASNS
jgi:hypothetical protein